MLTSTPRLVHGCAGYSKRVFDSSEVLPMSRVKFGISNDSADYESLRTLFQNIDLVLRHRDTILNTPDLCNISVAGCGTFLLYVGPIRLSLGDLVWLWNNECFWLEREGDDTRYAFCAVGSPLSGRHAMHCFSTLAGDFKCLRRGRGAVVSLLDVTRCRTQRGLVRPDDDVPTLRASLPPASALTVDYLIAALKSIEKT